MGILHGAGGGTLNIAVDEQDDMTANLETTSLAQRIVLCCLADAEESGAMPLNTAEIREASSERLEREDTEEMGHLSEADVMRALNGLCDTEVVDERRPDDRSPVGKGRPVYSLAVDVGRVWETLADDERVACMLD